MTSHHLNLMPRRAFLVAIAKSVSRALSNLSRHIAQNGLVEIMKENDLSVEQRSAALSHTLNTIAFVNNVISRFHYVLLDAIESGTCATEGSFASI